MFGLIGNIKYNNNNTSKYVTRDAKKEDKKELTAYEKRQIRHKEKMEEIERTHEKEMAELKKTAQAMKEQQKQVEIQRAYEDQFIYDQATIDFNNAFISTTANYQYGSRYNEVKGSFSSVNVDFNKNKDVIDFKSLATENLKYSTKNGQELAKDIANNSAGFTGNCSKYVRKSLQRTGLYNGHTGSAYEMASVLGKNENFQEISSENIELKQLPAGCVLVYDQGAAGYSSKHGHIEVTLGDGSACSDGRTFNVRKSDNMRIFVPVESDQKEVA